MRAGGNSADPVKAGSLLVAIVRIRHRCNQFFDFFDEEFRQEWLRYKGQLEFLNRSGLGSAWAGGLGTSGLTAPVPRTTGILLTNQMWASPTPPDHFPAFWDTAF